MAKTSISAIVQVACDADDVPSSDEITDWLVLAAVEAEVERGNCEVAVRVVDEDEIRELNRTYRGKDAPTNVLSFPADLESMPGLPSDDVRLLGDLIICAPVVAREASEQEKAVAEHWAHMVVHGVLHLLGYDHETDAEAERMESLEARILARRGLQNPYEDRRRGELIQ